MDQTSHPFACRDNAMKPDANRCLPLASHARHPGITDDELDVAVLQTFGRKRRTKQLATHLAKAKEPAVDLP